ncbi:hypothetical protein OSB04_027241 [Centaurea solstitialis]|uniref:LOB domain-containing protein n=1 Tax=Centaurea solstitialis TaxID=347529 RepID=A0AA38SDG5_9ASTR|nr:hypothetical protein OSB04_027241 [Centaurea solstitialis]
MDAESFGRAVVTAVSSAPVCSGLILLKLKVTPPSSSQNSSAAPASCPSSPPYLKINVHVTHLTVFCYSYSYSVSLFQSLLFEAAGRTVNPVNGAVGLLWTGNWHVCQASVETILRGGTLRPIPELVDGFPTMPKLGDSRETDAIFEDVQDPVTNPRGKVQKRRRESKDLDLNLNQSFLPAVKSSPEKRRQGSPSMNSEDSVTTTCLDGGFGEYSYVNGGREVHLLNLFK